MGSVGAIAVVDEPDIVGRTEHVEVEVRVDLVALRLCEVLHVVLRAKQTKLFSTPEGETHLPLQLLGLVQFRELLGDLQDRCRSAAIVVDAGPAVIESRWAPTTNDLTLLRSRPP